MPRLIADFNGLFDDGTVLCLSHDDTCPDETGAFVPLASGMIVTVFEEDCDSAGNRDDLIATGAVEVSPDWLQCKGSKWILRIAKGGIKHESEMRKGK